MGRSRLKMEGVGPIRLPSSKDDVVPVCSQNSSEGRTAAAFKESD